MNDEKTVRLDRMRYAKNSFSSGFALLAILFDVFFFISLYESDVGNYYYNILIGASILYNLIFMLAAFLCSEGVKNYKIGYSWLMILLGAGQIVRIFIYPVQAHAAVVTVQEQSVAVMGDGHIGNSEAVSNKISAKLRGWCDYKAGDAIAVSFARKRFFDAKTGEAIGRGAGV